jgi:hypothetical protein
MKYIKYKNKSIFFIFAALALMTSCLSSEEESDFSTELVTYSDFSLESISPTTAFSGESITITGSNFGVYEEAAKVYFNGIPAKDITSYSNTEIVVSVPATANSGKIQVEVWTNSHETNQEFNLIPGAVISYYNPSQAEEGETISVIGENFGTDASIVEIYFSGNPNPIDIISISDTEIEVKVPFDASDGPITIVKGPQTFIGPDFLYPTGRLKFLFNVQGDSEGFANGAVTTAGNFTWPYGGSTSRFDFIAPKVEPFSTMSLKKDEYPYLAMKVSAIPDGRQYMFFETTSDSGVKYGKWYKNKKNPDPIVGLIDKNIIVYDIAGANFTSTKLEDGLINRLLFNFTDSAGGTIDVDWIIAFKSIAELEAYVN